MMVLEGFQERGVTESHKASIALNQPGLVGVVVVDLTVINLLLLPAAIRIKGLLLIDKLEKILTVCVFGLVDNRGTCIVVPSKDFISRFECLFSF